MTNVSNIKNCYGCGVCATVCAKKIIEIRLNKDGFYEPIITEPDKCTNCGLCKDVCAFSHEELALEKGNTNISSWGGWSNDERVQRKCSSGGIGYEIAKHLEKFEAISVRERNGIDIIKNELHLKCTPEVVLDPTLLLTKQQWKDLVKTDKQNKYQGRKYILLYGLYYAFEPRPYIFEVLKYYKEKFNCEVIALEGNMPPSATNGLEMVNATDSSIEDFINLFDNALLVVTSSFQGTTFAVNFGILLVSIVPDGNNDDRQSTILRLLNLNNCIVNNSVKVDTIIPTYNKETTAHNLAILRKQSIDWINRNIN